MEEVRRILDKLVGRLSFTQTRQEQYQLTLNVVKQTYPDMTPDLQEKLAQSVLTYDLIEDLIHDPFVEDIMINGVNHIFIAHAREGIVKLDRKFANIDDLNLFCDKLVVLCGKKRRLPVMDMHLPEGGRINMIESPFGPQITIRKFRKRPLSVIELIEHGTFDFDIAAQLWLYTSGLGVKPANMLIAGIPGAGKTTLLNSLFSFFPPNERLIVIEDTLELNTEGEENCSRLEANEDTPMDLLVKNCLRMRPDRIIVGEVRGAEALHLMTAMNIGKITMGTIHAGTTREVVLRLEHEPMNVPSELIPLIDVIIVMKKVTIGGRQMRKLYEMSEVAGLEKDMVLLSDFCKYDVNACKAVQTHPSVVYRDRLSEASGLTPREILDELEIRKRVLMVLQKREKKSLYDISQFCRAYYKNEDEALASLGYRR